MVVAVLFCPGISFLHGVPVPGKVEHVNFPKL